MSSVTTRYCGPTHKQHYIERKYSSPEGLSESIAVRVFRLLSTLIRQEIRRFFNRAFTRIPQVLRGLSALAAQLFGRVLHRNYVMIFPKLLRKNFVHICLCRSGRGRACRGSLHDGCGNLRSDTRWGRRTVGFQITPRIPWFVSNHVPYRTVGLRSRRPARIPPARPSSSGTYAAMTDGSQWRSVPQDDGPEARPCMRPTPPVRRPAPPEGQGCR